MGCPKQGVFFRPLDLFIQPTPLKPPYSPVNLNFLRSEKTFLFLRSTGQESIAFGVSEEFVQKEPDNGFLNLRKFLSGKDKVAFGHIAYRMKDDVESLYSKGPDRIGFPSIHFFIPAHQLDRSIGGPWKSHSGANGKVQELTEPIVRHGAAPVLDLTASTSRNDYLEKLARIKEHIQRGDIYEINYCIEHAGNSSQLDPFDLFMELDRKIGAPHASFYRMGDLFAICMSPERFLHVENGLITTRPMKGTRPRFEDEELDEASREELQSDVKERAENIMAVDVARHDLSRVAKTSSVKVQGLCEVIPYKNVFQMVSTIQAELRDGLDHIDLLQASFPMASMTGAPKIRAMQLIEDLEGIGPRPLFRLHWQVGLESSS